MDFVFCLFLVWADIIVGIFTPSLIIIVEADQGALGVLHEGAVV